MTPEGQIVRDFATSTDLSMQAKYTGARLLDKEFPAIGIIYNYNACKRLWQWVCECNRKSQICLYTGLSFVKVTLSTLIEIFNDGVSSKIKDILVP
jgi:hypothetical protein